MKSFFGNIKSLDLFGSDISLHMNKSSKYTTQIGGYASVLAFSFIISFFWSRIGSFLKQEEVNVSTNKYYDPNPAVASISTDSFMFAVRVLQKNRDFITNPYFNITVTQLVITLNGNNQTKTPYPVQLEPCTPDHWEQMKSSSNFTQLFSSFGSDYLCPVLGQKLYIEGVFQSPKFQYLDVKVRPCVTPNDPNNKWNPICAPQSEVDAVTAKSGYHGMNIYHSNYVINPDQPSDYFTPYINDQLYFTFIPEKMTTLCDIYFQNITVKTDTSLFPFFSYEDTYFLAQENNDIKQTVQFSRTDGIYVILTLRVSPYISIINRSFKKVSQLMSELGGFIQIIFSCISIIVIRYNRFQFIVDLANNLYIFDQKNKDENKNLSNLILGNDMDVSQQQKKGLNEDKDSSTVVKREARNSLKQIDSSPFFISNHYYEQSNVQNSSVNFQSRAKSPTSQVKNQVGILSFLDRRQSILAKRDHSTSVFENSKNHKDLIFHLTNKNNGNEKNIDGPFQDEHYSSPSSKQIKLIDKMKNTFKKIVEKNPVFLDFQKQEKLRKKELDQLRSIDKGKRKTYIAKQFNQVISKHPKLNIGYQYFISKLTFNKIFNSQTNQYIQKATNLIHTDLDLCNILEKIQQIEKLKNTLFDPEQLMLFNFYEKPKIENNNNHLNSKKMELSVVAKQQEARNQQQQRRGILSQRIEWDSVDSYKKLFHSYEAIYHNLEKDNSQKRLILGLGPDILRVFEMSQIISQEQKQDMLFSEVKVPNQNNSVKEDNKFNLMLSSVAEISKNLNVPSQLETIQNEKILSKENINLIKPSSDCTINIEKIDEGKKQIEIKQFHKENSKF